MGRKSLASLLKETRALFEECSIPSAELDAQVLLAAAINKNRAYLFTHPDYKLTQDELKVFYSYVKRRIKKEPVAYILGYKEFWSHKFICTPATLIPRPETETIIELSIKKFPSYPPSTILDLGTGTGAIGITLASIWQKTFVVLTDISMEALFIAKKNAKRILRKNMKKPFFICCDWFSAISKRAKFDLITVNPPYISKKQRYLLQDDVKMYEPEKALFSRDDLGLLEIEIIFENAPNYLKRGGCIICEIGFDQKALVEETIRKINKYEQIEFYKDLSGIDRVVCATVSK